MVEGGRRGWLFDLVRERESQEGVEREEEDTVSIPLPLYPTLKESSSREVPAVTEERRDEMDTSHRRDTKTMPLCRENHGKEVNQSAISLPHCCLPSGALR